MLGRVFMGRYETIRLLGEGGMGRVYLAKQLDLGRQVVVKVMHDHIAADPTFRERFQRETLLMARFQHPYAVALYDASQNDPAGSCIVMEYIRGETLDVVLARNKRLDPARVGKMLHQACEVLYAAHSEGIIHRDLKPANLMVVDPDTQYELVKVMDFGLAKLLGTGEGQVAVTNHEFAVGTPGYMCPEQARGEDIDHRGDLYSLGVILFELLTGRLPFAGESTMDMLISHATKEPPSFIAVGAGKFVPQAIERVVQACLAKNPDHRPANARELSEMYTEALNASAGPRSGRAEQPPPPTPARAPRSARSASPLAPNVPESAHGPGSRPPVLPLPRSSNHGHRPGPVPASASAQGYPPQAVATAPEPVVLKSASATPMPVMTDPRSIVMTLEAWMPEGIATYKMRGFIQDVGGELVESVPGRINVRLGGKGCSYTAPARGLSWLGITRPPKIGLELRLMRMDAGRDNQLKIIVVFTGGGRDISADAAWLAVCRQIYIDLRAYLMGQNETLT